MPDGIIVRDKGLKGSDWAELDFLKKEAQKQEEELSKRKLSLVCVHIFFAPDYSINATILRTDVTHNKHDGQIFCCESCALIFDKLSSDEAKVLFNMKYEEEFKKKIKNVKETIKI